MNLTWKRTLRTASSERFLAQRGGDDVAAVDLHYLANGTIAGTVIILKGSGLDESNIQALLSALDDEFLPDVDLEHGNLTYTVVLGEVLATGRRRRAIMIPNSDIRVSLENFSHAKNSLHLNHGKKPGDSSTCCSEN